jgi:hypothetical protein
MRILRVRRGYTTNSSSANEYLPGKGSGSGRRSSTPPPSKTPPPATPPSSTGDDLHPWEGLSQPPPSTAGGCGWGGPEIFSLLGISVLFLFVLDRLVRVFLKKRRQRDDASPDE